ncbi:MAG TPA: hypothetical protein VJ739_15760 [Gemmataceae bacterium]|nr:hypothetical protein [Gemmataceae bacterium]
MLRLIKMETDGGGAVAKENSMSMHQTAEFEGVVARVRAWPPEMRLALAEELLRSLHPVLRPSGPHGVPADQVRGLAAGTGPAADDDTIKQWVHGHRMDKYG